MQGFKKAGVTREEGLPYVRLVRKVYWPICTVSSYYLMSVQMLNVQCSQPAD